MSDEKMRAAFRKLFKYEMSDDAESETFARGWQAALQEIGAGAVYECPKCGAEMEISMTATPSSGYFLIAPQSAQAIETAAIMKCVEVVRNTYAKSTQSPDESGTLRDAALAIEALIPQDGRTQLASFTERAVAAGMNAASDFYYGKSEEVSSSDISERLVTNLIGDK